jgi:hypothetical protein
MSWLVHVLGVTNYLLGTGQSASRVRTTPSVLGVVHYGRPGGLRSVAEDQPGGVSGPHGPGEVDRVSAAVLVDVLADQHRGV